MSGSLTAARLDLPKLKRFRALDERETVLDEMLDHYNAAQETMWSGQGYDDAADGGVRLMPSVWTASYRELYRALKRMEVLAGPDDLASLGFRLAYNALVNWYLRCEKHPVHASTTIVRTRKRGLIHEEEKQSRAPVRWRIVRNASPPVVLRGLEWIACEFAGEPELPREIVKVAA